MKKYRLVHPGDKFFENIPLASSKSESNRVLIIDALTGFKSDLQNLSSARDTQTMIRLLKSVDSTADVLDAGTTMRFLTAYFAATGQKKLMTGTERMCERPIGILVDALRILGADISYLGKEGYPPLQINGFEKQKSVVVQIRGDVSSQFISALLMIGPVLENGIELHLTGDIGSKPYITMTMAQMKEFGVEVQADWDSKVLKVAPRKYTPIKFKVESDWSGASYWYSVVALATDPDSEVELLGLKENSLQGDSVIVDIMNRLGVKSTFTENGVLLQKIKPADTFSWDFSDCPDLAQTVAVVLTGLKIEGEMTGLESLKIKETDRVKALQNELAKLGAELEEIEKNRLYKIGNFKSVSETPEIETYDDHRMALAFAPYAMIAEIIIKDPDVVAKSYPSFWKDLEKVVTIINV